MNLLYLDDSEISRLKGRKRFSFHVKLNRVTTSGVRSIFGNESLHKASPTLKKKALDYVLSQFPVLKVGTTVAVAICYKDLWERHGFKENRPFWEPLMRNKEGWYEQDQVRPEMMPYHLELTSVNLISLSGNQYELEVTANVITNY